MVPRGFQQAIAKQEAAKPSQADISSALPEECAVQVTGVRGKKRVDYKKVKIRNADGSLNKYGKNLLDLHRPAALAGADIVPKLNAGDLDDKPQHTADVERKHPLDPRIAENVARSRGLTPVRGERAPLRLGAVHVRDETGTPNLWLDKDGRLHRMAFVGTEESQRVETYRV